MALTHHSAMPKMPEFFSSNENLDPSFDRECSGILEVPLHSVSSYMLHSAFVPSTGEIDSIKSSIHMFDSTLSSVDCEIAQLRTKLAKLESYRHEMQENLLIHKAVLSPIRRLPAEIIGEIFALAAEGCRLAWPRRDFQQVPQDDMPWPLTKICSYWRRVAFSLHELWTEIHIFLDFTQNDFYDDDVPFARLSSHPVNQFLGFCLERSGNKLLSVSVKAKRTANYVVKPIISALLKHSERWRELSLDVLELDELKSDFAAARNRIGNLQRLHLGQGPTLEFLINPTALDAFTNCPNLKELSIKGITYPSHVLRIPWSQITHFKSKSNTFREGEFTQIVRQTKNLISLSTKSERILEVASSQPVLLPHLEKLSVVNKGIYLNKTFQFLTAPKLRELHIDAITPFASEQILPMLQRSNCTPTHLTFRSSVEAGALSDSENISIVQLLSSLSSLTSLNLTVTRSSDQIMPRLVFQRQATGGPFNLLPNLREWVLEDRQCLSVPEVVEAVSSRIFSGSLRSVSIRLSRPAVPQISQLMSLQRIAKEHGVDINLRY